MAREVVHRGRKIRVEVDRSIGPGGETIQRDLIFHPGAVVILPVLDEQRICLLRNYRFVLGETLWELPAGTVEPNEPLEDCARRELLEETGYSAEVWSYRGYLYASPGVLDEKLHLFIAQNLSAGAARPEVDEQLEPVMLKFEDAIQMCLNGEIKDAKTITTLLLWERLRRNG